MVFYADLTLQDTEIRPTPLIEMAFSTSKCAHEGQIRKTSFSQSPAYLAHPVHVAEILQACLNEENEHLIAAALCHDLLEDTDAQEPVLRMALGDETTDLIKQVSIDSDLKGPERATKQREKTRAASLDAKRLKMADRISNLMWLAYDPPENWSLTLRERYINDSAQLFQEMESVPDKKLQQLAKTALGVSQKSLYLAIKQRVQRKGTARNHWRRFSENIQSLAQNAFTELPEQPEDIADKKALSQQTDNLDQLYEDAAEAHQELGIVVSHLAKTFRADAIVPQTLKERGRSEDVINCRFQGDASKITDISRAAIICQNMEHARYVQHCLRQACNVTVERDCFEKSSGNTGYRDAHAIIQAQNGHFCEIQIHLASYWQAKQNGGQDMYNELRAIYSNAKGRELSAEEKKLRNQITKKMKRYYDEHAGQEHGFGQFARKQQKQEKQQETPNIGA